MIYLATVAVVVVVSLVMAKLSEIIISPVFEDKDNADPYYKLETNYYKHLSMEFVDSLNYLHKDNTAVKAPVQTPELHDPSATPYFSKVFSLPTH